MCKLENSNKHAILPSFKKRKGVDQAEDTTKKKA